MLFRNLFQYFMGYLFAQGAPLINIFKFLWALVEQSRLHLIL